MYNIVWIEDDIDFLRPVIRPLERRPDRYRIRLYHTFREANEDLGKIAATADLILLDLLGADEPVDGTRAGYLGLEFLKRLRQLGRGVLVICFTVVSDESVSNDLLTLGVSPENVLLKPVLPSALAATVDRALAAQAPRKPAG
jgi:CheY-like chemotaxis protein